MRSNIVVDNKLRLNGVRYKLLTFSLRRILFPSQRHDRPNKDLHNHHLNRRQAQGQVIPCIVDEIYTSSGVLAMVRHYTPNRVPTFLLVLAVMSVHFSKMRMIHAWRTMTPMMTMSRCHHSSSLVGRHATSSTSASVGGWRVGHKVKLLTTCTGSSIKRRHGRLYQKDHLVRFSSGTNANHNENQEECPLAFEMLPYRGASVRLDPQEPTTHNDNEFFQKLELSLDYWTRHDYNSAWLHVPTCRSSLIERLTDDESAFQFDLHHVNATENTIVLKKWLRLGSEDKIPPFATHQVGCAGFVLSEDNQLLLVKEWQGPPSSRTPSEQWKLPGGLLELGESFEEASCREVWEETGISTKFESLLAFWHRHGLVFGKSDFYFVCLLRPTTASQELCIDTTEISQATWMPLYEFMETQNHPLIWHILNKVYKIGGENQPSSQDIKAMKEYITPAVTMVEGDVQFGPNRPIYPTYTAAATTKQPQQ